jgi:hypothetical protein
MQLMPARNANGATYNRFPLANACRTASLLCLSERPAIMMLKAGTWALPNP